MKSGEPAIPSLHPTRYSGLRLFGGEVQARQRGGVEGLASSSLQPLRIFWALQ
jgi:hypothetical protein